MSRPAEKTRPAERILRAGTLPVVALLFTGTLALYIALVAFGNITDFDSNQQFVRHVLAMDSTFKDDDLMWRAVESTALQDTAYVVIIAWETLAALVLGTATVLWARGLRRPEVLRRAQRAGTIGLLMLILLFGVGFIGIGGEWFAMWQSEDWNGLDAATRIVTITGIALVVTHLPSAVSAADGSRKVSEKVSEKTSEKAD
ncbi:DUF2165 domain-containing protein [Streptomyces sp. NBC_01381]|uniref:DUF2165 domain-containing protein n=1 Tax=Streptomyces sp. NBC_01381 TaxID=2903845 RepID=UPI00224CEA14|nr:DUF2165 domain-containing protein [Streptomyces sp. NBC_01381]MCX4666213.1 DUF2165 domain-containing protein [Streptomyces sp. NBC_01381]